jgi:response regulator of citrate/malate metabolism
MLSVLIVEDEPVIARLLARCVSENRWMTVAGVAATRQQAIEMARRLSPSLVILDFRLPDDIDDGFAVWRSLHEIDNGPDVIAVTSFTDQEVVKKARRFGAVAYVVKPFTPAVIKGKLMGFANAHQMCKKLPPHVHQRQIELFINPPGRPAALPRGIEPATLEKVARALQESERRLRVPEVADLVGVERATANRYLNYLHDEGIADRVPEYGRTGHPPYLYTLASTWTPFPDSPASDQENPHPNEDMVLIQGHAWPPTSCPTSPSSPTPT